MVYALNILILNLAWRTLIENIGTSWKNYLFKGGRVISSGRKSIRNMHGDIEKIHDCG